MAGEDDSAHPAGGNTVHIYAFMGIGWTHAIVSALGCALDLHSRSRTMSGADVASNQNPPEPCMLHPRPTLQTWFSPLAPQRGFVEGQAQEVPDGSQSLRGHKGCMARWGTHEMWKRASGCGHAAQNHRL